MPSFLTPAQIKTEIELIRNNYVGRDIFAVKIITDDCPSCELDPVKNISKDPKCPQCNGLGRLTNEIKRNVVCNIRHLPLEDNSVPVGINKKGFIYLDFSIDDEPTMEDSAYFIVDGRKVCFYEKQLKGGAELNTVVYITKEEGVVG